MELVMIVRPRLARRRLSSACRTDQRRGAAVVEFAIVSPIFFMLILGMIEIGRALMVQQVLINASRVGARQAAMLTSSEAAVLSAVTGYCTGVGVSNVTAAVSPNPATAAAGSPITVTTSVAFGNVSWLPAPWFMGGKTLTSSAVMRKEGFE
jgi:Flp pilus assembly protein TadG